ncbi:hypothetical protein KQX54_013509 [Cotesia glomerata]|uniref:Uncharacterized protein n=1 Tax=Cotesia glomerata TaxID=32391 RepID=A0AAV7I2S0_COTGL|nr:hypothetical protein KQX54_013509 [Cotesia glomerata]
MGPAAIAAAAADHDGGVDTDENQDVHENEKVIADLDNGEVVGAGKSDDVVVKNNFEDYAGDLGANQNVVNEDYDDPDGHNLVGNEGVIADRDYGEDVDAGRNDAIDNPVEDDIENVGANKIVLDKDNDDAGNDNGLVVADIHRNGDISISPNNDRADNDDNNNDNDDNDDDDDDNDDDEEDDDEEDDDEEDDDEEDDDEEDDDEEDDDEEDDDGEDDDDSESTELIEGSNVFISNKTLVLINKKYLNNPKKIVTILLLRLAGRKNLEEMTLKGRRGKAVPKNILKNIKKFMLRKSSSENKLSDYEFNRCVTLFLGNLRLLKAKKIKRKIEAQEKN